MKIVVTGSQGFIGGYVVSHFLKQGHTVVGVDNFSKYGRVAKSHDSSSQFSLVELDLEREGSISELTDVLDGANFLIAGAAKIGGISYFHEYAYDLLAKNERIMANTCDAAIREFRREQSVLEKVVYMSSSMVFESTTEFPTAEGAELRNPPPISSYGFQKLSVEYFAKAAQAQYGLPYTIVRPFNCVGIGEQRALGDAEILSGNVRLAMSHVVPDLIQKVYKGQDPLRILGNGLQVRHYTHGSDLARGIYLATMAGKSSLNEDFNLSTDIGTTVVELAETILRKMKGDDYVISLSHDEPFVHDVQKRVPSTDKAREILGFSASVSLDEALDEIIPWVISAVDEGLI